MSDARDERGLIGLVRLLESRLLNGKRAELRQARIVSPNVYSTQINVVATFSGLCKIALRLPKELPEADIQASISRKVKPLSCRSEDDDETLTAGVIVWRQYCDGVVGCVY